MKKAFLRYLHTWTKKQSSYGTKSRHHWLNFALRKISPAPKRTTTALWQWGKRNPRCRGKVLQCALAMVWMERQWTGAWRALRVWLFSMGQTLRGCTSQGHQDGSGKHIFFHVKVSLRWQKLANLPHPWSPSRRANAINETRSSSLGCRCWWLWQNSDQHGMASWGRK